MSFWAGVDLKNSMTHTTCKGSVYRILQIVVVSQAPFPLNSLEP